MYFHHLVPHPSSLSYSIHTSVFPMSFVQKMRNPDNISRSQQLLISPSLTTGSPRTQSYTEIDEEQTERSSSKPKPKKKLYRWGRKLQIYRLLCLDCTNVHIITQVYFPYKRNEIVFNFVNIRTAYTGKLMNIIN